MDDKKYTCLDCRYCIYLKQNDKKVCVNHYSSFFCREPLKIACDKFEKPRIPTDRQALDIVLNQDISIEPIVLAGLNMYRFTEGYIVLPFKTNTNMVNYIEAINHILKSYMKNMENDNEER